MKKLITLAKELDFTTELEYYQYCLDSYVNGNKSQCKELFKAMKPEDRKGLLKYLDGEAQFNGHLQARNFYFDLL